MAAIDEVKADMEQPVPMDRVKLAAIRRELPREGQVVYLRNRIAVPARQ